MNRSIYRRVFVPAVLVLTAVLAAGGCSPSMQSAAGTLTAPLEATLKSTMLTRAASGMQTSAVEMPTLVIQAGKTGVARAQTQAPVYLTPARPATGYQIHPEDVILFQVQKPIKVHEAAYRFSTPASYLMDMNKAKYPSITDEESVLSPGWTIIIFLGTSGRTDLIPYTSSAWDGITGCGGEPRGDGLSCGELGLDYVSQVGRLRPECLPNTLAGEYSILSSVQGKVLYLNGRPFIYGVYWDAVSNTVLMGPGIITENSDEVKCG